MKIPAYLTNRDCLEPLAGMLAKLRSADNIGPITIIDCASTYPPLLEWYRQQTDVRIHYARNLGPRAPWNYIDHDRHAHPFYFVSDADLDIDAVPSDFLDHLTAGLTLHPQAIKAGLSLRLDDIPTTLPLTAGVIDMEQHYWRNRIGDWYDAPIDTTAAVYRSGTGWGGYGPAIRAAPPYTARHLAWYLDPDRIPPDWQHYLDNLSAEGILWTPRLKAQL